jgi:hypothetical protein
MFFNLLLDPGKPGAKAFSGPAGDLENMLGSG